MSMLAVNARVEDSPDQFAARCVERTLRCVAFGRDDGSVNKRVDLKVGPDPVNCPPWGTDCRHRIARGSVPTLLFFLDDFSNLTDEQRRDNVAAGTPDWRFRRDFFQHRSTSSPAASTPSGVSR